MKKVIALLIGALMISTTVTASSYQYISAADLKNKIDADSQGLLLDIQVEDQFAEHHIPGAVATFAFPVKSDTDKQKLQKFIAAAKENKEPITIVCPRGGGGAKRAYDYLKEQGFTESRLMILEGGQAKWSF